METIIDGFDDDFEDRDYERHQENKRKMLKEKAGEDYGWLNKNAKNVGSSDSDRDNNMKEKSSSDDGNDMKEEKDSEIFNINNDDDDEFVKVKKREKPKNNIDTSINKLLIKRKKKQSSEEVKIKVVKAISKSQEEKKKEFFHNINENSVNDLKFKTVQKEALYDDQLPKTNLENYIKQPNCYYPQKKIEPLVLPHLIKKQPPSFLMSEKTHKIVSNLLINYQPDNPEKKGIFAYDVRFIFTVSIFIITAIIIAYILLIHYSDLHLQKKEKEMDKKKEKYLISFQKGCQLDSYLFYIGAGFISISVFVLSFILTVLAARNAIFSSFKKI